MIYIFDIDGTLTPSRNVIDPKFKTFFEHFNELIVGEPKRMNPTILLVFFS